MAKRTVNEGFEVLLGKLVPLKTEHTKVTSHQKSVENCLINKFDCYRFFETGSFGLGTGVRHKSDSDYFAVIRANNLEANSSTCLRKIKEGLKATFSTTPHIEVRCPAVRIPFGNYESETMEITPCQFYGLVETPLGKFASYIIPNCDNSGWMYSSPDAHNKYVNTQNDRLRGKVKQLIQLVKAWKYYNDVPIMSFYLELRITKFCEKSDEISYEIDLKNILKHLLNIELASMKDPMNISGLITPCKSEIKKTETLSKLRTAVSRVEKAYIENKKGNVDEAFEWWNKLFNYNFPAR